MRSKKAVLALALAMFGMTGCSGDGGSEDESGDDGVGETGCRLSACSTDGFTYSCGSSSYSASTGYDYSGSETRVSTVVEYSNGHVVTCDGTNNSGSCEND